MTSSLCGRSMEREISHLDDGTSVISSVTATLLDVQYVVVSLSFLVTGGDKNTILVVSLSRERVFNFLSCQFFLSVRSCTAKAKPSRDQYLYDEFEFEIEYKCTRRCF